MVTLESTEVHAGVDRRIGMLMAAVAASLLVAAFVHLTGFTPAGTHEPFEATDAGVAEAVIGVVLASGARAVVRGAPHARTVALVTTGFAIAGFGIGLSMTTRGGDVPDIAYHAIVLPFLLAGLVALLRGGR